VCDVGWFMDRGRARAAAPATQGAVLLVDDSPFFRELLAGVLRSAGHRVVVAADADEAAAALADPDAISAIALDGDLGGEDGYVFARVLRDALEGRAPPIVGLDAHATPAARRRAQEAGMAAVIGKFDRAGLVAAIAAAGARAGEAGRTQSAKEAAA
jgi:two-component system chemotaxis sensor kinase CheA